MKIEKITVSRSIAWNFWSAEFEGACRITTVEIAKRFGRRAIEETSTSHLLLRMRFRIMPRTATERRSLVYLLRRESEMKALGLQIC